jgi:Thiol-disulfide isomerase and thioredoxins
MYKKVGLFLFAAIVLAGCKSNNIEINGKLLNSVKGELIYLDELRSNDLKTIDSVAVSGEGTFTFSRNIESSSFFLLKTDQTNFLTMLLEPGQKMSLKAYFDSLNYPILISGSRGTELMTEYNMKLRQTIRELSGLRGIYLKSMGTPELPMVMDSLDNVAQNYLTDINSYTKTYIDQNLNSLVSLVALYQQVAPGEYILHPEKDLRYFQKVDSSLSINYPDYEPVKSLHEQVLEMAAVTAPGKKITPVSGENSEAPEISLPTPEGDTINLSSTRGNVVLLDFWASWCSPCRIENPNLVKAYNLWHRQGFEIYQVSLDKTREEWLKGIKDDHLEKWIHVSDVKYWNSPVVAIYRIESIPANFLLDREGRIIASNLRGETLQTRLAELFKNKNHQ